MKITDHINRAQGKTLFSFEIVTPEKGKDIQKLYDNIDPLMEFNPPFIDVTTSREEYIDIPKGNGLFERRKTRKRPGTIGICAALKYKYNVDTVPHVLCGGFSKEETEYLLIDCQYLGIDNLMALRGDKMKHEPYFTPASNGHTYASELVHQIKSLNAGEFLDPLMDMEFSPDFCIGVAGYPEKHFESPSLNRDLQALKMKVDAGADYVVTQMFFDNKKYFEFVDAARNIGINVPIIPGIKPVAVKRHLQMLPQVFHLDFPEELALAIEKSKDNKQVRQVGIEWAIQQSKELLDSGVPVLHYYSMGRADNIKKIAEAVF
ncbi:MAG: methylenetetrahydrofolate reductase [NAD(P)H] [Flavobacteriaceae bacterium]